MAGRTLGSAHAGTRRRSAFLITIQVRPLTQRSPDLIAAKLTDRRKYELPRLKADRRADVVGDRVFLTSEGRHFIVQSPAAPKLIGLLDGTRSIPEIAETLSSEFSLPEILKAIGRFADFGHLVEGPPGPDQAETAWWDRVADGFQQAKASINEGVVTLYPVGPASEIAVNRLGDDLAQGGVTFVIGDTTDRVANSAQGAKGLGVVLVDDYLDPVLAQLNEGFLVSGRSWVIARLVGSEIWLGPLFEPGVTGCWSCMAQRLSANRQVERFVNNANQSEWAPASVPTMIHSSLGIGIAMVATEILRILAQGTSTALSGTLVTTDLLNFDSRTHKLVRQPQCAACGDPLIVTVPKAITLTCQPKVYQDDGGHRVRKPGETIAALEHHVSPLLGAITNLQRLTAPGDEISHAYIAGHNFAMFSASTYLLRRNIRGLSGGKGRTDTQAKASAMCEAIERYSGVWRGDEPVVRSSFKQLGDAAVHPMELLRFSETQYQNRAEWNSHQSGGLHVVPEPFDPERQIDWSQVWSISTDQARFVPSAYCYFGNPDGAHNAFCYSDSNGNAAGNTLEEAILQGMLELVERDAVAIWWYNRLRVPGVNLSSLNDPYVGLLQEYYASMGRSLWVLDITTDLGIPAFAAISHKIGSPAEDIIMGFGAHVDPHLAAMRALTECNQFLPMLSFQDSSGNTVYEIDDPETLGWWSSARMDNEVYLQADPDKSQVDVSSKESLASDDISKEVMACVERLGQAGMEVMVLDQSRPDLGLKVAKVMAPGMRHFWRRLGPGRLYDVPVSMGYLQEPIEESKLNPKSVFF